MADEQPQLPQEAARFLDEWLGTGWSAEPLAGDASVRAYYRVTRPEGEKLMLAYYPEAVRESLERFIRAHRALAVCSPVPALLRQARFAVAQKDVGDQTLFELLHCDREAALPMYRAAIDLLVDFQKAPAEAQTINPPFDVERFAAELDMTREFFVEKLAGRKAGEQLEPLLHRIAGELVTHPYRLCHRDFHGQNIHLHQNSLYVIDFQDMRMGPDTYDLASLLRDRGVGDLLGREVEEELIRYYASLIDADEQLRERYFVNLLQRSLKTIGTFARQAVERGRRHYLSYIPPALGTVELCLEELPRYAGLRDSFPMQWHA
jgi:N-acetylmuramate 1-kinase